LLEEEEERKTRDVMATLTEGMVMTGTVTAVREFGAFVSVGPIEGLLPISEIAYERVEDVQSVLSVGQQVEVAITRLDWANKRFSFSLKKTLADPWETAFDRFPADPATSARSHASLPSGPSSPSAGGRRPAPYIEARRGQADPERGEVLRAGQEIEVRVDSVDPVKRRVALSLPGTESAETPEEEAEDYSKYMEPAPPPPALGSLGEASRRNSIGNEVAGVASERGTPSERACVFSGLQGDEFEEVRHLAAPPRPVVVDVVSQ